MTSDVVDFLMGIFSLFDSNNWALMSLHDLGKSLAYPTYLGYFNDPATALRVTWKRTLDFKKQQSYRHVFQCFVFGPKSAGKSALLSSFVGRPFQKHMVQRVFKAMHSMLLISLGIT